MVTISLTPSLGQVSASTKSYMVYVQGGEWGRRYWSLSWCMSWLAWTRTPFNGLPIPTKGVQHYGSWTPPDDFGVIQLRPPHAQAPGSVLGPI